MPIPSYKKINIKGAHKSDIFDQLKIHNFDLVPHILDICQLDDQLTAIAGIDEYFKLRNYKTFPYPIYVIATESVSSNIVQVVQSEDFCPSFFRQKIRVPNVKESNLLNKIYLKQTNLKTQMHSDDIDGIQSFARGHKKLAALCFEGLFLEKIHNALIDIDELKDNDE